MGKWKRVVQKAYSQTLGKGSYKKWRRISFIINETFENPYDIKWKRYKKDFKQASNRFDRLYYKAKEFWIDVFLENGKIVTAFEIDQKEYEEILLKGDRTTFELIDIPVKEIRW